LKSQSIFLFEEKGSEEYAISPTNSKFFLLFFRKKWQARKNIGEKEAKWLSKASKNQIKTFPD
jgi:hypothetical protein